MTPLVLSGRAQGLAFADPSRPRRVLRLRAPGEGPTVPTHDAALIRTAADWDLAAAHGFSQAVVASEAPDADIPLDVVRPGQPFAHLTEGDVVGLDIRSGRLRVLYRQQSRHNAFLVTERCNNYCLMCSQPPKDVDDGWLLDEIVEALSLIDPATPAITFTGGEPLTEAGRFIGVVEKTKTLLPQTAVHVLSNGRAFADTAVTNAWAALEHPLLSVGIPVYSAVDQIHDQVVQARGAFDETILGILRLKDRGQRVEVRVVLHALTAPRLRQTCAWLARNLPFVDHVALMGLENTGFAIANDAQLWIDPLDYQDELAEAVDILDAARVRVSIYNLPLCLLPEPARRFAVRSISDWKNAYPETCGPCTAKDRCAGFFSTGRPRLSRGLAPILV
ncbi:His-Xaa-Ser system radical SAM maturase HxsC [Caulobacter sp. KR2-114]|uniref:His-Xaa-Ser system radical SAM maturase HxsC n=1 Tax=Caulobacter sp. KR2-114 TaxID=3400912 RepID=UPI003C0434D1